MIRIDLAMNYASLQGDISADMSRGRVLASGSVGEGTGKNERRVGEWVGDILTSHPYPTQC